MVTRLKPYNPGQADLKAAWHVIDADGKVLGRLASDIAVKLMGKDRPGYVPHLLSGDFVVVTNAAKVRVTGKKADQIVYVRHNQYPGHRREVPYSKEIANHPMRVIKHAVRGMLPKNKLGAQMLTRLKVYPGPEHPHSAQVHGGGA
jgi:large subunit ribosomal protein L13